MDINSNAPQAEVRGDLITCEKCGHDVFVEGFRLELISAIHPMNKSGRPGLRPFPTFACQKCGNVNEMFGGTPPCQTERGIN